MNQTRRRKALRLNSGVSRSESDPMKALIAIFVHVRGQSFGLVHGEIVFSHLPRVGEKISFNQPSNQCERIPKDHPLNPLIFTVDCVTHHAGSEASLPLIDLPDIELDNVASAHQLFAHFRTGFGLHADEWENG